ncbi:hypothetical protein D1007_40160 [Hordeum vulgare]|nr:hypothetical protein D1007_40160 [Hordeum vulgare]
MVRVTVAMELAAMAMLAIRASGTGKTEKVDMPFTRMHGMARLFVGVLDVEYVRDFVPWSYDDMTYDIEVEVEEAPQEENNAGNKDVDMSMDGDASRNQGTYGKPGEHSDNSRHMGQPAQPAEPQ